MNDVGLRECANRRCRRIMRTELRADQRYCSKACHTAYYRRTVYGPKMKKLREGVALRMCRYCGSLFEFDLKLRRKPEYCTIRCRDGFSNWTRRYSPEMGHVCAEDDERRQ